MFYKLANLQLHLRKVSKIISKKLLFFSLITCLLNSRVHAMHDGVNTQPKKESCVDLGYKYSQLFCDGWTPTLAFAGCAATYCLRYDRQAPMKALAWLKDSFVETPKLVAYPAVFLGMCCVYSYYKPRVNRSFNRIKN